MDYSLYRDIFSKHYVKMIDLKAIRKKLGLTQQDMAHILDIAQASYCRLEGGAWTPSADKEKVYKQRINTHTPGFDFSPFITSDPTPVIKKNRARNINIGYAGGVGNIEHFGTIDESELPELVSIQSEQIKYLQGIIDNLSQTISRQNEIIYNLSSKIK